MKFPLVFFTFFILGAVSLLAQLLMIRELMNVLYGNEFFIGLILGSWLAWTAAGSFCFGKFAANLGREKTAAFAGATYLLAAAILPSEIILVRFAKGWIGLAGEIPDLATAVLWAVLANAPLCLALGALFAALAKIYSDRGKNPAATGQGYYYECLGFAAAGIIFYFFLVGENGFSIVAITAILCLLASGALLAKLNGSLKLKAAVLLLLAVFGGLIFLPLSGYVDFYFLRGRFPGQKLVESKETPHGNIAVTQTGQQYNFYETGSLAGSHP